MKKSRIFGSILSTFGSIVSPVLYIADGVIDLPVLLNITTNELEDWIQSYNQNLIWTNNYEDENSEAFLAKIIGSKEFPEGIVLSQNTQHSRNRQLGIQLIGKTKFERRRESLNTGSEVSPYEIFMVSAGGGGRGKLNYERLTEWNNKIHIIEWEGFGSLDTNNSGQAQQRGVVAVSFLPSNKLNEITGRLNEWDPINVQDIDIKDVLKETVSLNYTFGNEKLNSSRRDSTWVKVSGLGINQTQDQQFIQEVLSNTVWIERSWYKGEVMKAESDGQWSFEEVEIPVPDKYYLRTEGNQRVELTREEINKLFKIESEEDGKVVIRTGESEQDKIIIGKNDLSVKFLIKRRNMNVARRVIKILFEQEHLENIETINSKTSYSGLESAIKRKIILEKFKEFDAKCSGNLIDEISSGGWITISVSNDDSEGLGEGGEDNGMFGDDFEEMESKFCDKYSYPKVGEFDDIETKLAEVVWDDFKKDIEEELTKLRNVLKKQILANVSKTKDPKKLLISPEKIAKINQICSKNNNSCSIKPATVTKYKWQEGQEELSKHIKANLTYLPDKFGLFKTWRQSARFASTSGGIKIDNLVPIIWSNQSFSQSTDESGKKVWSLNRNKQKGNKRQIQITKIKEWK